MAWTSEDFIKELQDVEKLLAFKSAPALQESLLVALLKKIDCSTNLLASDYVSMLGYHKEFFGRYQEAMASRQNHGKSC